MSNYNRYKASAKLKLKEDKANKHINFVVIAYVVILLYLLFIIYLSFTKENIHYVFAEPGDIYNEGSFNGLILRDEVVIKSMEAGPVKYFVPEGSKVRQNAYVCSVNQDAETEQIIQDQINSHLSQLNDVSSMSVDDYAILHGKIKEYVLDKKRRDTGFVYDSKDIIAGTILDISKTVFIKNQDLYEKVQKEIQINEAQRLNNGTYYKMEKAGVVGYTFDGFEDYNINNYDFGLLNQDVKITDVSEELNVSVNDDLYKIIDNNYLYLVSEVDSLCMKYLQDKTDNGKTYTALYFPRKNMSIDVKIFDLTLKDDKFYVVFQINKYFDTFFNDRFIDYRIIYSDYHGLKIPNEAVDTKGVYKVPYSAIFSEKGSYKIQKRIYSDDDTTHQQVVSIIVKIYYKDDAFAYIDTMDSDTIIQPGDQVLYALDESARVSEIDIYLVEDKIDIEGVYVLNKGYSDFRRIVTVYEDEAFRIIDPSIGYSVGMYDKVASDASEVEEFQTIN